MTSPSGALITMKGIKKVFYTDDMETHALSDIDFDIKKGEYVAISGPSGCGKTTLLSILGLLDTPSGGEYTLAGESVARLAPVDRARVRNRQIGFIFQDHHLLPQCTVLENVLIPTLPGAGANAETEARARELLARVGLAERIAHRPAQLSGGERQRVAVCRALINRPALLLADEPTGNLDRSTAEAVGSLLLDLNREQNTLLICVTHSAELAGRFPRHSELKDGKLVDTKTR